MNLIDLGRSRLYNKVETKIDFHNVWLYLHVHHMVGVVLSRWQRKKKACNLNFGNKSSPNKMFMFGELIIRCMRLGNPIKRRGFSVIYRNVRA